MKAYMISEQNITIFFNDQIYTMSEADPNFDKVGNLLKLGDYESATAEIDKISKLQKHFGEQLQLENNALLIDGMEVPISLVNRLEQMRLDGFDIKPMKRFIGNLLKNPAHHAIEELLGFLEKSDLPITDDGCFLAYKRVRDNYTDVHSGKINNAVGCVVSMPRYQVDDDRHQTCSVGLHFASLNYLAHFNGPRLLLLKINPADVVSIPADYHDSKGRCCRYEVIKELPMPEHFNTLQDSWESVWFSEAEDDLINDENE